MNNELCFHQVYIPKTCCRGKGEAKSFQPKDYTNCNLEAQALAQSWDTFHNLFPNVRLDTHLMPVPIVHTQHPPHPLPSPLHGGKITAQDSESRSSLHSILG